MTISVTQVDFATLSTTEAAAIRLAEQEAENFYGKIDDEVHEVARLSDLREFCRLMIVNPFEAQKSIQYLENSTLLTTQEKAILTVIAHQNNIVSDDLTMIRKYNFTSRVNLRNKTINNGDYTLFEDNMTAKLIEAMTVKPAKAKNLFKWFK